ncbi:MAG: diacylglycerol kinase family lipid kinase, partial [Anaerolineae bacterium]|nr:diacylglycerol kinase family lipid kinase [Anaerolineae bacterium]
IALGGDGTISEVANGLIGTGVPLAVLPGGTGNAVALELGIPGRLRQAVEVICDPASTLRPLDLGRVGDQYFVLRASIGMQAKLAEQATREMKSRYGNLAYLFSALSTLTDRQTATYTLTIDGEQVTSEGFTCLINNCGSIGGLNVSLNADIDPSDGLLDVFVLKEYTDPLLSIAADAFPQAELNKMLQYWQGREIEVMASEPQAVRLDGELYGETPLTVAVEPGAIQVLVPGK